MIVAINTSVFCYGTAFFAAYPATWQDSHDNKSTFLNGQILPDFMPLLYNYTITLEKIAHNAVTVKVITEKICKI